MADRQNGGLPIAEVVGKVERAGRYRLATPRRPGLSREFLRDFRVFREEFQGKV